MTIPKSLIPLVLLVTLLLVACEQQQTASLSPEDIPKANKASVTFAVAGMTWPGWDKLVEQALLKLPGVASANADKPTRSAVVVYDKTIFKPEELGKLGRYSFSIADTGESSEEPDASGSSTEDSDADEAPSQFDLGDFSNLKPAADPAAAGQEDELPLLGGPEADQ